MARHIRTCAGRFHLDESGNITNGIEDVNAHSGLSSSVPFTGNYTVGADRRGSFTITTSNGTATYHMTVASSGDKASFIRYDSPAPAFPNPSFTGSGYFELQTASSGYSLSAVAGQYAIGISQPGVAEIGRFTVDTSGTLSQGSIDVLDRTSTYPTLTVTGNFSNPSSNGRGTAALTLNPAPGPNLATVQFVYYIVSDKKIVLVQTDAAGTGEIKRQSGSYSVASFNAPAIFKMTGSDGDRMLSAVAGQILPNGSGSLAGILDQNLKSSITLNEAFNGTYSVDASGRCTMTLHVGSNQNNAIAYFFGENEALLMQTTGSDVLYGSFEPQSGGPFATSSVSGSYGFNTGVPIIPFSENDTGVATFDGFANFHYLADYNVFTGDFSDNLGQNDFSGTYNIAANGRGTLNLAGTTFGFWVISPNEIVAVDTTGAGDQLPVLLNFGK